MRSSTSHRCKHGYSLTILTRFFFSNIALIGNSFPTHLVDEKTPNSMMSLEKQLLEKQDPTLQVVIVHQRRLR